MRTLRQWAQTVVNMDGAWGWPLLEATLRETREPLEQELVGAAFESRLQAMIAASEGDRKENRLPYGNVVSMVCETLAHHRNNRSAVPTPCQHGWVFGFAPPVDRTKPCSGVLVVAWTISPTEDYAEYMKQPDPRSHFVSLGVAEAEPNRGASSAWPETFGSRVPINSEEEFGAVGGRDRLTVRDWVIEAWLGPEITKLVHELPLHRMRMCSRVAACMSHETHKRNEEDGKRHDEIMAKIEALIPAWGDSYDEKRAAIKETIRKVGSS